MLRKGMTDEQGEAASLRRDVEVRLRRLRALVDQIELQANERLTAAERGEGAYTAVAEVFVKELAQGLVNVGVEGLIRYATTADIIHAETTAKQNLEG